MKFLRTSLQPLVLLVSIVVAPSFLQNLVWGQSGVDARLSLVVKLNGKELKGLRYLAMQMANAPTNGGGDVTAESSLLDGNRIREGIGASLAVLLVLPNSKFKDITHDDHLKISGEHKDVEYRSGVLRILPLENITSGTPRQSSFSVTYAPKGENGPMAFDTFPIEVTK